MPESNHAIPDTNGWNRYQLYVMQELKRLSSQLTVLDEKVTKLRIVVASRGAMWGAISGAMIALAGYLLR